MSLIDETFHTVLNLNRLVRDFYAEKEYIAITACIVRSQMLIKIATEFEKPTTELEQKQLRCLNYISRKLDSIHELVRAKAPEREVSYISMDLDELCRVKILIWEEKRVNWA